MVWPYERPVATSRHVSVPSRRAPHRGGTRGEHRGLRVHRAHRQDRSPRPPVRADHGAERVPLRTRVTLYSRLGDWLAYLALAVSGASLAYRAWKRAG